MMLEPSVAKEIRESANGRERVRSIIAQVCNTDSKRVSGIWDSTSEILNLDKCVHVSVSVS